MSGNALWQQGYITLVNLKLTSEQLEEREKTDTIPRQISERHRQTRCLFHLNYLKSRMNVTVQIGYCTPINSLSGALLNCFSLYSCTQSHDKHATNSLKAQKLVCFCVKIQHLGVKMTHSGSRSAIRRGQMHYAAQITSFSGRVISRPPTQTNNGRRAERCAVSSIANGVSCLILACRITPPDNICDMCAQGRGNKAILDFI